MEPTRVTSIAERVRLLDSDGQLIRIINAADAGELLHSRRVEPRGTKTKIRAVRYLTDDRGVCSGSERLRTTGLGDPHRRESDTNVDGVWCFDRLPKDSAHIFTRVVRSVLRKKAA